MRGLLAALALAALCLNPATLAAERLGVHMTQPVQLGVAVHDDPACPVHALLLGPGALEPASLDERARDAALATIDLAMGLVFEAFEHDSAWLGDPTTLAAWAQGKASADPCGPGLVRATLPMAPPAGP